MTNNSQNRDHAKKLNPCLVEFSLLPDPERNFNLAKSLETIRTVVALGYNIALYDKNAEQRLKKLKFSQRSIEAKMAFCGFDSQTFFIGS